MRTHIPEIAPGNDAPYRRALSASDAATLTTLFTPGRAGTERVRVILAKIRHLRSLERTRKFS